MVVVLVVFECVCECVSVCVVVVVVCECVCVCVWGGAVKHKGGGVVDGACEGRCGGSRWTACQVKGLR